MTGPVEVPCWLSAGDVGYVRLRNSGMCCVRFAATIGGEKGGGGEGECSPVLWGRVFGRCWCLHAQHQCSKVAFGFAQLAQHASGGVG